MIKSFTKNSNFLNISKSISEKYIARLDLENCGMYEFSDHPVAKSDTFIKAKGDFIQEIVINGTVIKNDPTTILMSKDKELFCTVDMFQSNGKISIVCRKLTDVQFSNELMGFQFKNIEKVERNISIDDILIHVGHVFNFKELRVVFFNKLIY